MEAGLAQLYVEAELRSVQERGAASLGWELFTSRQRDSAGWNVVVIEQAAVLWKGTFATTADGVVAGAGGPQWYGNLYTASHYAFNYGAVRSGENGKLIALQTAAPIVLLDMMDAQNLERIDAAWLLPETVRAALRLAFGTAEAPRRASMLDVDAALARWICETFGSRVHGWGHGPTPTFHGEVMLCDAGLARLRRLPWEIRAYNRMQIVVLTYDGTAVQTLPRDIFMRQNWITAMPYTADWTKRSDLWLQSLP